MFRTWNPLVTITLLQLSYRHKVTIVLLQAIISLESHYHTVGFKAQAGKSVDREASGQPVAGSLYHLTE